MLVITLGMLSGVGTQDLFLLLEPHKFPTQDAAAAAVPFRATSCPFMRFHFLKL